MSQAVVGKIVEVILGAKTEIGIYFYLEERYSVLEFKVLRSSPLSSKIPQANIEGQFKIGSQLPATLPQSQGAVSMAKS